MFCTKQAVVFIVACVLVVSARPDSAGHTAEPAPGISYGGIPYGSMSGNVAEYFKKQAPSGRRLLNLANNPSSDVNFAPIEQWLR